MIIQQRTIQRRVAYAGSGLHTGEASEIVFLPAPVNHGIVFRVAGLAGPVEVPALVEAVPQQHRGARNTTLSGGGVQVQTVEHVLAALAGMGITNCVLELSGPEPPEPPDGSVAAYVELLESAGIVDQGLPGTYLKIAGPVRYQDGDVSIVAEPADRFVLTFHIDYDDPLIGVQQATFEVSPDIFKREIAPCRTFALKRDVARLQAAGLGRGGTLRNAVIVDEGVVMGDAPLRFPDEFVRHKILDLLGDLSLLGMPIQGHVTARLSGHDHNVGFVRLLAMRERKLTRIYPPRRPLFWDIGAIMEILPHRYPLLLVDRIVELVNGKRVVGIKNVSINEPFFQGHFPGHPIMPAVLIVEGMAQTGGVLLLSSVENPGAKLMYFSGIDGARFRRPVIPGDQLRYELELVKLRGPLCKMRGETYVGRELVAEAELMSTVVER
jgi:UDP-3-O-[3-hydroxymyristoyl] N-acetylglucosamine deacetylase/3-hydroxyacyl-[acyl-carrier-protein] dehydratase